MSVDEGCRSRNFTYAGHLAAEFVLVGIFFLFCCGCLGITLLIMEALVQTSFILVFSLLSGF